MDPATLAGKPIVEGFADRGVLGLCVLVLLLMLIFMWRQYLFKDQELANERAGRRADNEKAMKAMLDIQSQVIHAVNEVRDEAPPVTARGSRRGQ